MNLTPALATPILLLGSATHPVPASTTLALPPAVVYAPTVVAAPPAVVTGPASAPSHATVGSYHWFYDNGSHAWHRRFVHHDYHHNNVRHFAHREVHHRHFVHHRHVVHYHYVHHVHR